MHPIVNWVVPLAAATVLAFSSGCVPAGFKIGGNITGLEGQVVLSLNNAETLNVSKNGAYKFVTRLAGSAAYEVTVSAQPLGQECVVTAGSGIVNATVSNVAVKCVAVIKVPVVTHVWPDKVLGGFEVKVSGSNLDPAEISFNGAAVEPTFKSAHELRFIAPQNPAGVYALELENSAGVTSYDVTQGTVLSGVQSVSTAYADHTCALIAGGSVKCWGANSHGQLGNGSENPSATAVSVFGLEGVVSISPYCAVLSSGAVKCWSFGLSGSGAESSLTPVLVPGISNALTVSGRCATLTDGSVTCWGPSGPMVVSGIDNAVTVSQSGDGHTCALLSSGAVKCWGSNVFGQLGNGTTTDSAVPVAVNGISNAISISAASSRSCAVLGSGAAQCWGSGRDGDGNGGTSNSPVPVTIAGISNAVAVDAGLSVCVLISDGSVKCWGNNSIGSLGNGDVPASMIPVAVKGIHDAVAISNGPLGGHHCVILASGVVQCWGGNLSGESGIANVLDVPIAVTIAGISNAVSLSSSDSQVCTVTSDSSLYCWGDRGGIISQLTDAASRFDDIAMPVAIPQANGAIAVAANGDRICALIDNGQVRCSNPASLEQDTSFFDPVPTINDAVDIAVDSETSCAVLGDGSVKCWGSNPGGVLGNGTTSDTYTYTPVTVLGVSKAIKVSLSDDAGESKGCALLKSGSIQCWGTGYLGDGNLSEHATAVEVRGISNAVAVDGNCAVLKTGEVNCWGSNAAGRLGNDGFVVDAFIPVPVLGIGNAVALSSAKGKRCAVLSSGEVKCWGYGTTAIPSLVEDISAAVAVSASNEGICLRMKNGQLQCLGNNWFGQLTLPSLSSGIRAPVLPISQ